MERRHRLRHSADFRRVRQDGKNEASTIMVLAFVHNQLDHTRFGFVVNRRLGNAVQRNKLKRRMRESIRHYIAHIQPGFDVVLIARQPLKYATYDDIDRTVSRLLQKTRLLSKT